MSTLLRSGFLLVPLLVACGHSYPCDRDEPIAVSVPAGHACPSPAVVQAKVDSAQTSLPTHVVGLRETDTDPAFLVCWYRVSADEAEGCIPKSRADVVAELDGDLEWEAYPHGQVICANGAEPALLEIDEGSIGGKPPKCPDGSSSDDLWANDASTEDASAQDASPPDASPPDDREVVYAQDQIRARTRCTYDTRVTEICGGGSSIPMFGLQ